MICCYFMLQNFYMIGRDKSGTFWRVLKIDRLEPSELNIQEDSTTYSESECFELLKRIHEGNKSTGGLKFVTNCYGIVGKWNISAVTAVIWSVILTKLEYGSSCLWFSFCRVYQVPWALLHVTNHKEKTNWCHMWPYCVCCHQEWNDSPSKSFSAVQYYQY